MVRIMLRQSPCVEKTWTPICAVCCTTPQPRNVAIHCCTVPGIIVSILSSIFLSGFPRRYRITTPFSLRTRRHPAHPPSQCRADYSSQRDTTSSVWPQHYDTEIHYIIVVNAMQCHAIVLDTTATTHNTVRRIGLCLPKIYK